MGLSIAFRMKVKTADADRARGIVRQWHARVSALSFDDVSPVEEYDPPGGRYAFERADGDAEGRRWKPGDHYLKRKRADGREETVRVPARHVCCFHCNLRGAETASFGLASHPPVVVHREDVVTEDRPGRESRLLNAGDPVEVPTRLRGWYSWSNGCKTQYAGNPKLGGPANFVRAHTAVFAAIDVARSLGLTTFVRDDAKYYRHRDPTKLAAALAKWDGIVAGFAGRLSDALGDDAGTVVAPIKDRPDFEHLEAQGTTPPPRKRRRPKPEGG